MHYIPGKSQLQKNVGFIILHDHPTDFDVPFSFPTGFLMVFVHVSDDQVLLREYRRVRLEKLSETLGKVQDRMAKLAVEGGVSSQRKKKR